MEGENLLFSDDDEIMDKKKKDPGFDVMEKIKELMKKPSPPQKKMPHKFSHKSISQDGINKGVKHCIKRPRFKITKVKEGLKHKKIRMKEKNVKIPQRLPTNRSPVKKSKWHKLSSPGTSLLETPDSSQEESPLQSPKFFTSRSKAAAIVKINKSMELSTINGELTINHKPSTFEKKNIGRIVESELERKIAAATLNSPVSVNRLEEAGQLSSVSSCSTPPRPTRFLGTPSPKRSAIPVTPKRTPLRRTSPRKQLLKSAAINSSPSRSPRFSPYSRKSTPKNELNADILTTPKSSKTQIKSNHRVSPRKRKSLLKSLNNAKDENKCFENGGMEVDSNETLEDFDSEFDPLKSQTEEDEILANILKENQSPEKEEAELVRRSPRKHVLIENRPQDASPKKSRISSPKQKEKFKYFPIFEPRHRRSQDLTQANKISTPLSKVKTKKFLMKKGDPSQLVIDAGQKIFGHVFCKECGVLYEVGDPEDEQYHMSVHYKIYSNLKFNSWKNERQVTILDEMGGRILMVASNDHNQWWKKVKDVLKIVDEELGFSENCLRCLSNSSAYLYILDRQIVGVLIVESIEKAYRVIQIENVKSQERSKENSNSDKLLSSKLICCSNSPSKVSFGISRIWVLGSYRGKGIAAKLVDAMRGNSVSWCYLKVDDFAFSDPTPNGMRFAQKYTKKNDFLVYRRE